MTERQLPGLAGILFLVAFIVGGGIQGDTPTYNDSGAEIASWFEDNSKQYLIGDFITGIAFIFFYFPYLMGLYLRLRGAESEPALWSRVALAGGLLFPLAGLAGGISLAALALLKGDVADDTARLAAAMSFHGFVGVGALQAVLLGAAAIVVIRTGAFWRWLGWLGAVLAVLAFIGTAITIDNDPEGAFSFPGVIAFIGFGVWILASSIAMLRVSDVPVRQPA